MVKKQFAGPVRPETDEIMFRRLGLAIPVRSVPPSSGGGRGSFKFGPGSSYTEPKKKVTTSPAVTGDTSVQQPKVSADIAASQQQSKIAAAVRAEAKRRNIDVSTRVRERGFVSKLKKEEKQRKILEEKQEQEKLFLKSEKTGSIKSGGREVPVSKIVVVNDQGKVIRKATASEIQQFKQGILTIRKAGTPSRFLEKTSFNIQRTSEKLEQRGTSFIPNIAQTGLGVASSIVGTATLSKNLVTQPVTTFKGIYSSFKTGGASAQLKSVGQQLKSKPSFVVGQLATDYATARAVGKVVKVKSPFPQKIEIVGVSQKITGNIKRTDLIFETKKGIGTAVGLTTRVGDSTSATIVKGVVGKTKLISGKFKPSGYFGGAQLSKTERTILISKTQIGAGESIITKVEKVSASGQVGVGNAVYSSTPNLYKKAIIFPTGKIVEATKPSSLLSISAGVKKGTLTGFVGKTFKSSGKLSNTFRGIVKDIPKTSTEKVTIYSKAGLGKSSIISSPALQETASAVSKSLPKTSVELNLPISKLGVGEVRQEQIRTRSVSSQSLSSEISKVKVQSVPKLREIQFVGGKQKLSLTQRRKTQTRQELASRQVQPQPTTQKINLNLKQKQLQRQKVRQVYTQTKITPTSFIVVPKPTTGIPFKSKSNKKTSPKRISPSYSVAVRRRGKFKSIASGLNLEQAFNVGRSRTAGTLAATFKVQGGRKLQLKTPKGYYSKPTKSGTLFIERRGLRLSTIGETREIQRSKRRKKNRFDLF